MQVYYLSEEDKALGVFYRVEMDSKMRDIVGKIDFDSKQVDKKIIAC